MQSPERIIRIVRSNYPRPSKLSDPGGDFSPEELEAILRKPNADLTEVDLMAIFQGALPAGEYRESVHFLPCALDHILRGNEETTLCGDLFRWIQGERDNLRRDALFDELLKCFEAFFAELVSRFLLNEAGDSPLGGDMARTLIESANSPDLGRLGDAWLEKYLGNAETYEQAAWLVVFLEDHLWRILRGSAYLQRVAEDKALQRKAYEVILPRALGDETLLRFWSERFDRCGLGQ